MKSNARKKKKSAEQMLASIDSNIHSLIENDKLLLDQFDKLQDEVSAIRDDTYETKTKAAEISMRLYGVELEIKTVKRLVDEEPKKRKDLEERVRKVLPTLPQATRPR